MKRFVHNSIYICMEFSTLDLDWSFKLSSVYLVAEYLSVKMYSLKGLYGLMVLWLKKTE